VKCARPDALQAQIDPLRSQNADQAKQIQELKAANGEQWLTEQRAEQVRGVVRDVLADSADRASFRTDGNYRLNIEGQIQSRYAFNFLPTAAFTPSSAVAQNEYGFELRRVRRGGRQRDLVRRAGAERVFVTPSVEVFARWEGLWVSSDNDGIVNGSFVPNALVRQQVNAVTLGTCAYFNKNQAKFAIDGGWAMDAVRFTQGLFGESILGADWRASPSGEGVGQVVVRAQLQLLF